MKKTYTLKFIFSLFFCLLACSINGQQSLDSIPIKKEKYGLRVGADLYKTTRTFYDEDYKGIEIIGDYRMTKNVYLAGELGNENITIQEDRFNFTTRGSYFKVGLDYNFYENWLAMQNQIYIGFRYSVSTFSQELNNYRIYQTNPYFGLNEPIASGQKFNGLSAHWVELVLGFKAELLPNLYGGISARISHLVSNQEPDTFENLFIPGFNKTYSGNFGVGLNYTLSYFIPIYKK
jgi:hypothetical protein